MTLDAGGLLPQVHPSPEGRPFWDGLRAGAVRLPHCRVCDQPFFYPRPVCPACGSRALEWRDISGRGRLEAFCVHTTSAVPGLTDGAPFATALVRLDEGPRLMGFLVGVPDDPELIRCGVAVTARFLPAADGATVLGFEPLADGG